MWKIENGTIEIEYEVGNKYTGFKFNQNNHVASCKVTRISPYTGKENTIIVPITYQQYGAWKDGTLIQNAFPNLRVEEREFILTGLLGDEFEKYMGDEIILLDGKVMNKEYEEVCCLDYPHYECDDEEYD